ncbi:protein DEK, putative [Entamoeba invadens IP1]|uniref:protein DEK, putative n=1 Tax=Entamoeba invadens IP1 TaxID=370355 RepID=UPI0002C3E137|nr:protein DEK, putative [Entamoeba invadens IP1]ELP90607.1 protein DEK, putative [Entamoeba invadens IP1]|eukprot:XP_004257378.1 protein DEK, putative [Entamoeba invadens IP1]
MRRRTRSERKKPERLGTGTIGGVDRYKGNGIVLGTSKLFSTALTAAPAAEQILVHRLLYQRQGSQKERLNNILSFCGFETDDQAEKCQASAEKRTAEEINSLCAIFKIEEDENKVEALVTFFKTPTRPNGDETVEFEDQAEDEEEEEIDEAQMEEDDEDQELYDENEDAGKEEEDNQTSSSDDDDKEEKEESEEPEEEEPEEEENEEELDNVYEESITEKKKKTKKGSKEKDDSKAVKKPKEDDGEKKKNTKKKTKKE